MSIRASAATVPVVSANAPLLREIFTRQVRSLVYFGHQRMNWATLSALEEPEITGQLVHAMREVVDDPAVPSWARHFAIHDDSPIFTTAQRRGKARRRVDIHFEGCDQCPHPRMHFEAKRLNGSDSVNQYIGHNGLGCFMAGEDAYAKGHPNAGMLGYVQRHDEETWATSIAARLQSDPTAYALLHSSRWEVLEQMPGMSGTYQTCHLRIPSQGSITIYHMFLRCHVSA